jgi:multiple antibiotic resistance protein
MRLPSGKDALFSAPVSVPYALLPTQVLMLESLIDLIKAVGIGLVLMLPLSNPLTSVTMLLSLGGHIPYRERERQIKMATIYVVGIMLVTYFGGTWIMKSFGISIPGLRIAGGLIVGFIGFTMLFPSSTADDTPEDDKAADGAVAKRPVPNIAFVPLAMPGTAGPGTIAMIISTTSTARSASAFEPWVMTAAAMIVFLLLGLLFWVSLRSAGAIVSVIGQSGVEAVSRVMGFLLVCMAVQFVIHGVQEIVAQPLPVG